MSISIPFVTNITSRIYFSLNEKRITLFVFVELDVENLPFSNADAGMAALMTLIAIMTAKILYLTLMVES